MRRCSRVYVTACMQPRACHRALAPFSCYCVHAMVRKWHTYSAVLEQHAWFEWGGIRCAHATHATGVQRVCNLYIVRRMPVQMFPSDTPCSRLVRTACHASRSITICCRSLLVQAWRDVAADDVRSVWLAKQAGYHRSLTHTRASMFDGRAIVSSHDPLPAGMWVVQPWPTSPLLWRHHRFILRTWVAIPSIAPLRVYMLQVCVCRVQARRGRALSAPPAHVHMCMCMDMRVQQEAWAHVVAKPYRPDQLLTNYRDTCVHLWSKARCSVTHAHRVLRSNHEAFTDGLVGIPVNTRASAAPDVAAYWRRRVWPMLEDAATRAVAASWRELAM